MCSNTFYRKAIKPIWFINKLNYIPWYHLASTSTSNSKSIDRTKYLQPIKAWDQPATENTVGFSLPCHTNLRVIWLKSQIITLISKPTVPLLKYIACSQRVFLKFYMSVYLEHINSISRLFQEIVSIFLGNKYMWLKKKSSLKKKIWSEKLKTKMIFKCN